MLYTLQFIVLVAFAGHLASALDIEERDTDYQERYHESRFVEMAGGDEKLHIVDLEAGPDNKLIEDFKKSSNNGYILFTRKNPKDGQTLAMNDASSITSSNFNKNNPTVVIVHGWLGNKNSGLNPAIRDAYLGKSDVNVIVMDWSRLSWSDYVTAARGVPAAGVRLGQFMNFLHELTGAPYQTMHLVGFSLGAHIVGNAARTMGGQVARVTGLDPAGPLWYNNDDRLRPTDAVYVEAIHTDGGKTVRGLGIRTTVADADFYPNGGRSQPGCSTDLCNHNRSWELFAATVTYNHLVGHRCSNIFQLYSNNCRGELLNMGNDILTKTGHGTYRLATGRKYPF